MKNGVQNWSRVIKRVITANLSGEHYWFVEKPKPGELPAEKEAKRVWISGPQMEETSPGEQRVRVG